MFCSWAHTYLPQLLSSSLGGVFWEGKYKMLRKCLHSGADAGQIQPLKPGMDSRNLPGLPPKLALDLILLTPSGNGFGDLLLEHDYPSWYQPSVSELWHGSDLPPLYSGSVYWHCETFFVFSVFDSSQLSLPFRKCSWKRCFSFPGCSIYFII